MSKDTKRPKIQKIQNYKMLTIFCKCQKNKKFEYNFKTRIFIFK